jgi:hypothetical protein
MRFTQTLSRAQQLRQNYIEISLYISHGVRAQPRAACRTYESRRSLTTSTQSRDSQSQVLAEESEQKIPEHTDASRLKDTANDILSTYWGHCR